MEGKWKFREGTNERENNDVAPIVCAFARKWEREKVKSEMKRTNERTNERTTDRTKICRRKTKKHIPRRNESLERQMCEENRRKKVKI